MSGIDITQSLDARVAETIDACTACGKCLEICPMTVPGGIDTGRSEVVTAGVLDILKTGSGPEEAEKWSLLCSLTGRCIDACEYGVNPRFMLGMARRAMKKARVEPEARTAKGKENFAKMVKGVRTMSGMQLPKAEINNFTRPNAKGGAPEIVFWTGCNVWRTPHIVMHCLDILDAVEVPYEVLGGPGNCCGIIQLRTGDDGNSLRQAGTSNDRFAATGAQEVVSWCPTCQMQFDETLFHDGHEDRPYDTSIFAGFLASRLDRLKEKFTHRVERKVGLHLHGDIAHVNHGVREVLSAIPGLEIVDFGHEMASYQCNSITLGDYKAAARKAQLDAAAEAGVDTLAVVYHGCYRDLCTAGEGYPFEVVNYVELVGAAMGVEHPSSFKKLKLLGESDKVLDAVGQMIAENAMDPDEVRTVVDTELLGK
jgi:heterodisulfide reductase subunit D